MLLPARTLCSSPALRAASLRVRLLQTRPAVASPRSSPPSPHLAPSRLLSLSARPRCVPSRSQTVARLLSTTPTPTPPPPAPAPKPPLPADDPPSPPAASSVKTPEARENPYTLPNAITVARMAACPVIGYYILEGDLATATGLLFVAGVSDLVDGWLARRFNMGSVLGSILDPAADKLLMTTMVVTLAMRDMLPLPLAVIILGRDVALSLAAFYFRYASLPPPKTFTRYWDFSIPSASVHPTAISKYNTFLQLVLVGSTTVAPLLPFELGTVLTGMQWLVAGTTIASGLSYVGTGSRAAVKYVK
ncbi:phosphatidyl synthase [Rhodotorula diobovata]|uniref:Phosphatidyl synthase n=1 Tax=Rhodotorula diobovata TaxID=5288 RepID=A0A5C5FTF6_9BASI|nr:phosphatidyl synthase [Rhodotorula diobovata]